MSEEKKPAVESTSVAMPTDKKETTVDKEKKPAVEATLDVVGGLSGAKEEGTTKKKKTKKNVIGRQVNLGRAYIKSTYNNTLVTLTDQNGNVLAWSSAGQCGFKGPKKATPYAASVIVKDVCEKVKKHSLKEVSVFVKGIGGGREAAIRAFNANGLTISGIQDITPIPHNGCRLKKPRRV